MNYFHKRFVLTNWGNHKAAVESNDFGVILRNGLKWMKGVKIIIRVDIIFKLRVNVQQQISV